MAAIQIGNAPESRAVLPFYGAAAIAFLMLSGLLFAGAFALQGHFFHPHILAMVHAAALGWGTMIIFGAAYQLLPVVCERHLYSPGMALTSFFCLSAGAVMLVSAFWNFRAGWIMIIGGLLIFAASVMFLWNVIGTAGQPKLYSVYKAFIVSSAAWLSLTALIGILLAIHLRYPFIPKSHLEILKLHAHAGLAGWFLQLIIGISSRLVPMFLLGKSTKHHLLRNALWLQNLALVLFLIDGYFNGTSIRYLLYGGCVVAGIIFWLLYLGDVYRHRLKKKMDFPMRHTLVSFISLLTAVILLPVLYISVQAKWAIIYGLFLFLGWISSIVLGMTFKTLPFIVWNNRYKQLNGIVKIPLPKQLYSETLLRFQFWLFVAALYITALSLFFDNLLTLKAGLLLFMLVALLYNINVFKILVHKTKSWRSISI
jgi:cbb3-type cytochrome oxidase subunit 1